MQATAIVWGYIGVDIGRIEKKMGTTVIGYIFGLSYGKWLSISSLGLFVTFGFSHGKASGNSKKKRHDTVPLIRARMKIRAPGLPPKKSRSRVLSFGRSQIPG